MVNLVGPARRSSRSVKPVGQAWVANLGSEGISLCGIPLLPSGSVAQYTSRATPFGAGNLIQDLEDRT
jgi:hypothetical protein